MKSQYTTNQVDRGSEGGLRTRGKFKRNEPARPLVSVITVVLNGEMYLEQTILSVINQTYDNVEYIIIDGGSNDSTLDIIRRYEDKIDYWVSEEDAGIAEAFNKGISLCRGELVGTINADDWYEYDAIEKVVEINKGFTVFCGHVQYWNGCEKDYVYLANINNLPKEMTVNHPAVFVSMNIYDNYGVFDSNFKYAMDYELLLRFYMKGVDFIEVDYVLSNMRMAGISDKYRSRSFKEVRLAKIHYGEPFLAALGYNYWQLIRKRISSLLSTIGLESIVMIYRSRFSAIKKHKRE